MPDCYYKYSATTTIHYVTLLERTDRPTVLCLHGFGASLETWHDIRAALATESTVYMLDLKGFGLSSKPSDGAYAPVDQARLVATFIRDQRLRNVILVGHSFGGGIAVLAHKILSDEGDESPKGLILIDPALYDQRLPLFVNILRWPIINHLVLRMTSAKWRANYILEHIFYNRAAITNDRTERYARFLDAPGAHESFIATARHIDRTASAEINASIECIKVPVLLIWGAEDPVVPIVNGERLRRALSMAKMLVIPACGHVPHEEHPEPTIRSIVDFVRRNA